MVHSAIKQMAQDTDWGELDILIIDMPPEQVMFKLQPEPSYKWGNCFNPSICCT